MNHEPGNCPVCHKPLQSGQDIVTCPSCGAPYHRECYLQEGQCVFASQHAAGFEYQAPKAETAAAPKNEGGVLCPQCKTVNEAANIFCESCGAPLHDNASAASGPAFGAGMPPFPGQRGGGFMPPFAAFSNTPPKETFQGEIDGIPATEWAQFIGSSAPVYLARLQTMERTKRKVSFMLSAFLFSPTYFAYRKMWGWAAISLTATILFMLPEMMLIAANAGLAVPFSLSANTLAILADVAYYLEFLMRLVFGFSALLLFRRFAVKRIRQLRLSAEGTEYQDQLVQKGGVSMVGVALVLGILLAFSILLSVLMGDALLHYFSTSGLFF